MAEALRGDGLSLRGRKRLGKLLREARQQALSKEERTAIARKAVNARWAKWRAEHKVDTTVENESPDNS